MTITKGSDIVKVLKDISEEKGSPLENIVTCASDNVPAMVGGWASLPSWRKKFRAPSHYTAVYISNYRQHLDAMSLSK